MTTADVLATVVRRWYVAVLVLAVTAVVMHITAQHRGVYFTEVTVRLLVPDAPADNVFVGSSSGLVATTGLVERSLPFSDRLPRTASPRVTLPDRGIYRGVSVTAQDGGGQYGHLFAEPELDVQAVGRTATEAVSLRDAEVAKIRRTLDALQARYPTAATSRIEARVIAFGSVSYVQGRRARAMGMELLLGGGLALGLCWLVDRGAIGRRSTARSRFAA